MADGLPGYRGEAYNVLDQLKIRVGDLVNVIENGEVFEGILMPRYELADDQHLVLKLKNGYNIGVKVTSTLKIHKVGVGETPSFKTSTTQRVEETLPTIAIISTGGTIASRIDYRTGAVHSALSADDLCSVVPELSDTANIRTAILFSLFSENLRTRHWTLLAESVSKHIKEGVDGVVICHGTDTMAYSSAALSFALQNLPVPVILVGSQRSSDRPSSDAAINLVSAVKAAAQTPIAEVMVCMHESPSDTTTLLHRGTKVRKCHTSRRDAFKSINAFPLNRIQCNQMKTLATEYAPRDPKKQLIVKPNFEERVAFVKFYPGFNPMILRWYVNNSYLGIVVEGTGLGHLAEDWYPEIEHAVKQGVIVAMTSQCIWGRVNMNVYATGMDLQKLGVLPLGDMLSETATIKMMWALGQTKDVREVKNILLTNIAGEIDDRSRIGTFF